MFNHLKKLDWPLAVAALSISGIGLLTIYGIGSPESLIFFKKQLVFTTLGFLVMIALSFFDYRIFKNYSIILVALYLLSLFFLALVLFSGEIRGASSWFRLGSLRIEPIEFIKIIIILFLAKYFSFRHIEMYRIRHLIVSGAYVGLPVLAILFQPDIGSILVLSAIWLGVVIVSGIKIRHLIALLLVVVLLLTAGWFGFLEPYQKQRIITFLNPQEDPYGQGYHINQSLIAIGSGQLFGKGLDFSSQAGLNFLPEQHNDFIFATLAEQRGLAGVFFLLILYALLFWRIIKVALGAANNFSRLFAVGFTMMIFVQMAINIGMNMAVLPITGLTLPFVSYGGSSLMSIFIGMGILQGIKARS
ncbi:MAG: rod shape-determining protein RodA [Patescibacteria group bacterium]|nr:rod shape-determining protein RodA [Patescibacteria group bacterium]